MEFLIKVPSIVLVKRYKEWILFTVRNHEMIEQALFVYSYIKIRITGTETGTEDFKGILGEGI